MRDAYFDGSQCNITGHKGRINDPIPYRVLKLHAIDFVWQLAFSGPCRTGPALPNKHGCSALSRLPVTHDLLDAQFSDLVDDRFLIAFFIWLVCQVRDSDVALPQIDAPFAMRTPVGRSSICG